MRWVGLLEWRLGEGGVVVRAVVGAEAEAVVEVEVEVEVDSEVEDVFVE